MSDRLVHALDELEELALGIHFGRRAWEDRLRDYSAGVPSRGEGGRGGAELTPTEAGAASSMGGQADPAAELRADFERHVHRALAEVRAAFRTYLQAQPRPGLLKLADPGCELCAQIPGHWCATYATIEEVEPPKTRHGRPTVRRIRLCSWCHQFRRPDRADRLPTLAEVELHSRGIIVRYGRSA